MASWITVYNRASVGSLTPAQLLDGLRARDPAAPAGVDYDTLAESYDIDDGAVVRAALAALRVERDGEAPGFDVYAVCYAVEPDARPVLVRRWTGERVPEEITEALDNNAPPPAALDRLRASTEVIGIEIGASQLSTFGVVLAYEVARYLAQKGDGILCDLEGCWTEVAHGGFADL